MTDYEIVDPAYFGTELPLRLERVGKVTVMCFRYNKTSLNGWCSNMAGDAEVEKKFQEAKYSHLKDSPSPKIMHEIKTYFKNFNPPRPTLYKSLGSKSTMKEKFGVELDVDRWEEVRVILMHKFVQERYRSDALFRKIINYCQENHILPLHNERAGKHSFGGGTVRDDKLVGKNHLGRIFMLL